MKLGEEHSKKHDHNINLRAQEQDLEKELDMLKAQRADNKRELVKLKEINEMRVREGAEKTDRLKALDYDLSKTQSRIEDEQKFIEGRNYDLRNKQGLLEDASKEIARIQDQNGRLFQENDYLKKDIDKALAEAYDLRKEVNYNQTRNQDMADAVRGNDIRLKEKDEQAYLIRKDLDNSKMSNSQMRENNIEMLNEKDALDKHA